MDVLHLFRSDTVLLSRGEIVWLWTTAALSALIVVGYVALAFVWYFQSRLAHGKSAVTLSRLRNIFLICAICGYALWMVDLPWVVWRVYNVLLFALACYTWSFVFRTRGLGLIDELEQTASRYREIAELLPHIVWTATGDGRIDYTNQQWTHFSDAPSWLEAVQVEDRSEVFAWWDSAVKERAPAGREVRLVGRDGCRTFVVRITPVFHGPAVKWLGACADIEDQKQLALQKELQAKQRAFFLNALSHDLRAPLNSVVLNAHLLKMAPDQPPDMECVSVIIENAVAAGDLLSQLLEYARTDHEQKTAEPVIVNPLLHQIRRRFLPIAQQKGLELQVIEGEELICRADRHRLDRIISNLVDNAVKHTAAGRVELSSVLTDERVVVRVTDTGSGVPEKDAPHLFDEFYQVNNHERDRNKGFGLGLSICRSLARQLGGDVRLARTGTEGSCFEVVLPPDGSGRRGRPQRPQGDHANPAAEGVRPAGSGQRPRSNAGFGPTPALGAPGLDVA